MIKNILFDLDGTLFDFCECENESLGLALNTYGIQINDDYQDKYKEINISLWQEYEKGLISKKELLEKRFEIFLQSADIAISYQHFNELYLYFLSNSVHLEFGALEILHELKNKYNLYIVTNGDEKVQLSRMKKSNISNIFNGVYTSERIGFNKPNNAFFEYCLEDINCKSNECIIVGDSLTSDIVGGKMSNILTCWYNPSKKENEYNIIPEYEINNLLELRDIIKQINERIE